jgi:dihydrolipoamide dehydrogenase
LATPVYDVIIIGAGPGGYVAAIRAAQLGLRTAIVEQSHLGGVCLNWGCIPTKALLRSAEALRTMQRAAEYGLSAKDVSYDLRAVVDRSRRVAAQLASGVAFLLAKNKIQVIWGKASIPAAGVVEVAACASAPKGALGPGTYRASHLVIATGARPRALPGAGSGASLAWTYREAMTPESFPKSLLVVGSGAIGVEFASFYRTMGADVTVAEILPQILPIEDEEIAAAVRKCFEKKGMRILTEAKVRKIEKAKKTGLVAQLEMKGGQIEGFEVDAVISAVGVACNIENLGLEALGLETNKGAIVVDGFGRTSVPGIYAIGDVAGGPMLAHKAEHEGVICVEAIAGKQPTPLDKSKIPGCTYCDPQVASVGLTEAKARQAGIKIRVGRFPLRANGKAIALGEPEGFVKTIFDAESGQLLGAHMIGADVTELIQGFVIAMNLETTEQELLHSVLPHPTLSEAMHESVLAAYDRALHI